MYKGDVTFFLTAFIESPSLETFPSTSTVSVTDPRIRLKEYTNEMDF
jgi:hypothetical protein